MLELHVECQIVPVLTNCWRSKWACPLQNNPAKGCNCSCHALQIQDNSEQATLSSDDDSSTYHITLLLQQTVTDHFLPWDTTVLPVLWHHCVTAHV